MKFSLACGGIGSASILVIDENEVRVFFARQTLWYCEPLAGRLLPLGSWALPAGATGDLEFLIEGGSLFSQKSGAKIKLNVCGLPTDDLSAPEFLFSLTGAGLDNLKPLVTAGSKLADKTIYYSQMIRFESVAEEPRAVWSNGTFMACVLSSVDIKCTLDLSLLTAASALKGVSSATYSRAVGDITQELALDRASALECRLVKVRATIGAYPPISSLSDVFAQYGETIGIFDTSDLAKAFKAHKKAAYWEPSTGKVWSAGVESDCSQSCECSRDFHLSVEHVAVLAKLFKKTSFYVAREYPHTDRFNTAPKQAMLRVAGGNVFCLVCEMKRG